MTKLKYLDLNTSELKSQLKNNPSLVSQKNYRGQSLLHRITQNLSYEPMQTALLLEYGAKIHETDQDGLTPLHTSRDIDTSLMLYAIGAPLNAKDINGNTPLHHAAKNGDVSLVKLYLDLGAKALIRNSADLTAYESSFESNFLKNNMTDWGANPAKPKRLKAGDAKWFWEFIRMTKSSNWAKQQETYKDCLELMNASQLWIFHEHLSFFVENALCHTVYKFGRVWENITTFEEFYGFACGLVSLGEKAYLQGLSQPETLDAAALPKSLQRMIFSPYNLQKILRTKKGWSDLNRQQFDFSNYKIVTNESIAEAQTAIDPEALAKEFPKLKRRAKANRR